MAKLTLGQGGALCLSNLIDWAISTHILIGYSR